MLIKINYRDSHNNYTQNQIPMRFTLYFHLNSRFLNSWQDVDQFQEREISPILICKIVNNSNSCLIHLLISILSCSIPKSSEKPSRRLILVVTQASLLVALVIFLGWSLSSLLVTPLQKACRIVLQVSPVVVNLITPLIDGIFRVVVFTTRCTLEHQINAQCNSDVCSTDVL